MTLDLQKIWKEALNEIEGSVSRPNFITWFTNTYITKYNDKTIYVCVPNSFVREWHLSKYHKETLRILRNHIADLRIVEYIISPDATTGQHQESHRSLNNRHFLATSAEQPGFSEFYIDRETNLNPKYSFDSFVVGSFNEVAYSAGLGVVKNLGSLYNPLFIYGGVGLGKTHLLQSIGNKVKENTPGAKIHYMTSEKFAAEYVNSIQNKDTYLFKEKYRKYNLLIIDDIQFFSGKMKIQEEFFHVFNSLYDMNNQIIFSSDKPPKHIPGLEDRLRSRFEGGMIVDVSEPEYESRLAILKAKIESRSFPIELEVLEYIATVIQENIRELEGALNSVIGQSKIKNKTLSLNEVKEILKRNSKPVKTTSVNQVIKAISDFYNIDNKYIFKKTRKKEVVRPRQIAMYILREDLNSSYPFIGQKFGQKDHTTVMYAYKKISGELEKDTKLSDEIKSIRGLLYGAGL